MVRARLERHVESRPAGGFAGLLERDHFGVTDSLVLVPALAHHFALADDDGPDERVIGDLAPPTLGELERPPEMAHGMSCWRPR